MDINLFSFLTGQVVDDKLYYSSMRYNGLFAIDLLTYRAEFVGRFPEERTHFVNLHCSCCKNNEFIYFLPNGSKCIHSFNCETKEIQRIEVWDLNYYTTFSQDSFIAEGNLWLVPQYVGGYSNSCPFLKVNLETGEIEYRGDINEIVCKDRGKTNTLIWKSALYNGFIWMPICRTSIVYRLDIKTGEVEKYDTNFDGIWAISATDCGLLLNQISGSKIALWEPDEGKLKALDAKIDSADHLFSNILKLNDGYAVLPGRIGNISIYSEDFKLRYIDNNIHYRDARSVREKHIHFGEYKNKYIVYPNDLRKLILIDKDSGIIEEKTIINNIKNEVIESYMCEIEDDIYYENVDMSLDAFVQGVCR